MEIYLIRHTTPDIESGICYGQSEIRLAPNSNKEIKQILEQLPNELEVVYSSPLIRCLTLAEAIPAASTVKQDKRLLELNFGEWELQKWDKINPDLLTNWMNNFVQTRTPNGENLMDLYQRVNEFVSEVFQKEFKDLAIVTHAGVIRCIVASIMRTPPEDIFSIPSSYAGITKIHFNKLEQRCSVEYINRV